MDIILRRYGYRGDWDAAETLVRQTLEKAQAWQDDVTQRLILMRINCC